jgi:SM-20-related protein
MFENTDMLYIERFLSLRQRRLLRECADLKKASTASGDTDYRGDYICWLDENNSAIEKELFDKLNALREWLYEPLLGINSVEAHIAYYPPGTSYGKHFDAVRNDNKRVLSLVTYLNESWKPEDGGQLRLYHRGDTIDVPPTPSRTVVFLSTEVEHEVLKTNVGRWSIAAWFRR